MLTIAEQDAVRISGKIKNGKFYEFALLLPPALLAIYRVSGERRGKIGEIPEAISENPNSPQ